MYALDYSKREDWENLLKKCCFGAVEVRHADSTMLTDYPEIPRTGYRLEFVTYEVWSATEPKRLVALVSVRGEYVCAVCIDGTGNHALEPQELCNIINRGLRALP